jgi:hypothetical protein
MAEDMEKRIQQFIAVRDFIKEQDDAHKAKMKDHRATLDRLTGLIQVFMDENKLENLKTKFGTAYTSVKRTASLADPDVFMNYVIENKAFDLLDRRANSTAVQAFVDKHKVLPPGCNLNSIANVGVRRAGVKDDE